MDVGLIKATYFKEFYWKYIVSFSFSAVNVKSDFGRSLCICIVLKVAQKSNCNTTSAAESPRSTTYTTTQLQLSGNKSSTFVLRYGTPLGAWPHDRLNCRLPTAEACVGADASPVDTRLIPRPVPWVALIYPYFKQCLPVGMLRGFAVWGAVHKHRRSRHQRRRWRQSMQVVSLHIINLAVIERVSIKRRVKSHTFVNCQWLDWINVHFASEFQTTGDE